jgi:hypothetical protein
VKIYEEEEGRLGVNYTEDGIIQDPERPLAFSE